MNSRLRCRRSLRAVTWPSCRTIHRSCVAERSPVNAPDRILSSVCWWKQLRPRSILLDVVPDARLSTTILPSALRRMKLLEMRHFRIFRGPEDPVWPSIACRNAHEGKGFKKRWKRLKKSFLLIAAGCIIKPGQETKMEIWSTGFSSPREKRLWQTSPADSLPLTSRHRECSANRRGTGVALTGNRSCPIMARQANGCYNADPDLAFVIYERPHA